MEAGGGAVALCLLLASPSGKPAIEGLDQGNWKRERLPCGYWIWGCSGGAP